MSKKQLPGWFGLIYLAIGVLYPLSIWADFRQTRNAYALDIFTPERWGEITAQQNYTMANAILLSLVFLFQFVFFYWGKSRGKQFDRIGAFLIAALFIIWICLPRVMPLPQSNVIWVFDLVALCAAMIYILYKLIDSKRQEEE